MAYNMPHSMPQGAITGGRSAKLQKIRTISLAKRKQGLKTPISNIGEKWTTRNLT